MFDVALRATAKARNAPCSSSVSSNPFTNCAISINARALKKEKLGPRLTPPTECHVGEGFVSVIVPAYNEGNGIKLTLATIDELAQVCPAQYINTHVVMLLPAPRELYDLPGRHRL